MLQTRTIEPRTLELLKTLMTIPELSHFYLVGGTALALQIGHRFSIDLDLFTAESFNNENLLHLLTNKFDISIESERENMIITTIDNIKVDFVKMSYPILFPTKNIEKVRMLDIKDIAAMKLKAIVQRGSKKDFFDIHYLLQQMSLNDLLALFKRKFKQHETFHVIKSLTYFEDAEQYPDPIVFDKKITWLEIKEDINKKVKNTFSS